jgi:hemerythrin-like domain-containing protein
MVDKILHDEHVATLEIINKLEMRIGKGKWDRRLEPSVATDKALLEELVAMMDSEVRLHLPFEEKELFPRLDEFGFEDVTNMLFDEHEAIRSLISSLRPLATEALANGFKEDKWALFYGLLADLASIVIFHIQKEEMGVISRLPMLLGLDGCAALASRYEVLSAGR